MVPHTLEFYQDAAGHCPTKDYLRAQSKRVRGEAGWLLTRLEREAPGLRRPLVDCLNDGIYELRVIVDRQQHRLFFFYHGDSIVVTHGFLKKSGPVPAAELDQARRLRADWLARGGHGGKI